MTIYRVYETEVDSRVNTVNAFENAMLDDDSHQSGVHFFKDHSEAKKYFDEIEVVYMARKDRCAGITSYHAWGKVLECANDCDEEDGESSLEELFMTSPVWDYEAVVTSRPFRYVGDGEEA